MSTVFSTCLSGPRFRSHRAGEALEEFAKTEGLDIDDRVALVSHEKVEGLYQSAIDELNTRLAKYETIKKFRVLSEEFTQESGELTPTLKVKRRVVQIKFKELIDGLYD